MIMYMQKITSSTMAVLAINPKVVLTTRGITICAGRFFSNNKGKRPTLPLDKNNAGFLSFLCLISSHHGGDIFLNTTNGFDVKFFD